jgi:hypothetical protein
MIIKFPQNTTLTLTLITTPLIITLFSLGCANTEGMGTEGMGTEGMGTEGMGRESISTDLSSMKADMSDRTDRGEGSLFSYMTPLGAQLLNLSRQWVRDQVQYKDEYAQPRMCAHNVSHVLDLAGLYPYGDYLVPNMLNAARVRGGQARQLPRDHDGLVHMLNTEFGGRLPVGTLVNGCLYEDCTGEGGDGHIALLGHTDEEGVVWLYHNNWYRPDHEGGVWREHMVSKRYYYDLDLRRQWMATPWIRVTRDPHTDLITDIEGLLPAIDDLDPFTGFFITLTLIPELLKEIDMLDRDRFFCPGETYADPILGACVDGETMESNVYGPFSEQLIAECESNRLGQSCRREVNVGDPEHSVMVPRWSRGVYTSLRGDLACPRGLKIDHDLPACVSTLRGEEAGEILTEDGRTERGGQAEVFGPFLREWVERCQVEVGDRVCTSGRWPIELFKHITER